jgi:hypothetical protein
MSLYTHFFGRGSSRCGIFCAVWLIEEFVADKPGELRVTHEETLPVV